MSIPAEMFTFDPKVSEVGQIGGKRMSSEMQNIENSGKGDGKKKILIGVVAAVVVILLVSVVSMAALLIKSNNEKKALEEAGKEPERKAVVTAENVDEVLQEMQEDLTPDVPMSYIVTQNAEWIFPDGKSPSTNAVVENDSLNETPVYFEIKVDATGEIVYSSPVLELGAQLTDFSLDKPLDAGTYTCTVVYHLVDENQNELTTVNVGTSVVVEN